MPGYGKLVSAAQEVKHDYPAPTPAPVLVRDADARKRQAATSISTTFTVTKAPDSTCGFLSGSAGVAITCENKKTCIWEAQYVGAVFCGSGDNDPAYLRCFPREAALNTASCNDVCQSNTFNLLCTGTASPYCRTYVYPSGVRDYRCAATPVSGPQSVLHTYNNQDYRTLTISEVGGSVVGFIPSVAATSRVRTTPFTSGTSGTGTGTGTATATITPSNTPSEGAFSPSPPVGAIVGGVVGGLAALSLLILGAFFLIRRSKKNQDPNPTQYGGVPPNPQYAFGNHPPMQQQQQYGGVAPSASLGPVSPASTYDSTFKGGHASISIASAVAPGPGMRQEEYNGMSYGPPVYQQAGSSPPLPQQPSQGPYPQGSPSPPMGSQQPVPTGGGYPVPPQGYGQQLVHEIGTMPDQHRGQVHEVS